MLIAVFSKDRLFLDALSSLVGRRVDLKIVAKETNPQDLISSARTTNAQLLLIDGDRLNTDEMQFFLGARAVGGFILALIGENELSHPVDATISRSASTESLYESISSLALLIPRGKDRKGKRAYGTGNDLTHREFEVAEYLARGMSNRTISEVSELHEQSVKNLVCVIMRKLKCENRTQVALKLLNAEVETRTE